VTVPGCGIWTTNWLAFLPIPPGSAKPFSMPPSQATSSPKTPQRVRATGVHSFVSARAIPKNGITTLCVSTSL
jgi:hypothetical protein